MDVRGLYGTATARRRDGATARRGTEVGLFRAKLPCREPAATDLAVGSGRYRSAYFFTPDSDHARAPSSPSRCRWRVLRVTRLRPLQRLHGSQRSKDAC